jgi:hypothetical protein
VAVVRHQVIYEKQKVLLIKGFGKKKEGTQESLSFADSIKIQCW